MSASLKQLEAMIAQDELDAEKNARESYGTPEQKPADLAMLKRMIQKDKEDAAYIGDAIVEPVKAIGGSIGGAIVGGLAGGAQALNPFADEGAAERTLNDVTSFMAQPPKTERGEAALNNVTGFIDSVVDLARIPVAGIASLVELATGQGLEASAKVARDIKENGFSQTFSDSVFEETDSPTWGTVARVMGEAPLALLSIANPSRGLTSTTRQPSINAQRAGEIDEVLKAGKSNNVDVLTSDIFPPRTAMQGLAQQFSERIPYAGTSGKRGKQQTQRIDAVNKLDEVTPNVKAEDIYESLAANADKLKKAAGKRIGAMVDSMDEFGEVPLLNAKQSLTTAIDGLTRKGKIQDKGLIKQLESLRDTVNDAGVSFKSAREFRSDFRSIMDKSGVDGKPLMRTTDGAMLDKVYAGITKDLNDFVKSNTDELSFTKYRRGDLVYRNEARNLSKSRLKTVLNKGDVKPELINGLLFSSSPSEVALLYKGLNSSGRANARMALMRQALDKATKKGEVSPQVFSTQLDKLANNFKVFYKGAAKREIDGLKRLLETTRRAADAGVVTPTGQALQAPAMAGLIGAALFGEGRAIAAIGVGGTVGLSAKLFESSGVRDALISLGKSTRGGQVEAALKRSIPLLLQDASREKQE